MSLQVHAIMGSALVNQHGLFPIAPLRSVSTTRPSNTFNMDNAFDASANETAELRKENEQLKQLAAEPAAKIRLYEEQFRLGQQRRFGASRERIDPDQPRLFNEAEAETVCMRCASRLFKWCRLPLRFYSDPDFRCLLWYPRLSQLVGYVRHIWETAELDAAVPSGRRHELPAR